ncbi:glycosyltransferase family 4 protein [Parvularcula lutaonensis]|uniref:Glycosyltransferase family 4 protein n=1 Tax=Parvularcula lutaonensis TaxID=491923 RepID=A0ABV7MDV1_9PROT|nr:glycosyltransferase family 1 protein [Parvularcula lutaonensis]GGY54014.1 hypothetical protein GCM10007148_24340 [Parvularcula lutaonensis]
MSKAPILVLDVSRFVSRLERTAPTGIDRVELEAVEAALTLGDEARFMATRGRRSWFIAREQIRDAATALKARWAAGTEEGRAAAGRLYQFLGSGAPAAAFEGTARPPAPRVDGPRSASAILQSRRAEAELSKPEQPVTYRNVSHHHLDKDGFLSGLKERWAARIEIYWHDAIPILWPEYSKEGDAEKHLRRLKGMLGSADLIEVNSCATRDELAGLAQRFGLPLPETVVSPLRSHLPEPGTVEPAKASRPYFVTVGTIEPRKNHRLLLEVWRELARSLGERTPALVIAGRRGWMNSDTFALLDRCPLLSGHVHEAPDLPDAALASVIAGAEALLMPSFAEGFGLPVVEAQALGTHVIASDLPVFREVATAEFDAVSPLAGDVWLQRIRSVHEKATAARQDRS